MTAITTFGYRPHSETASQTLDRIEKDGLYFAIMGSNALRDADRLLVECNYLEFGDVYDTVERDRLYARRDEIAAKLSRAIEEAE